MFKADLIKSGTSPMTIFRVTLRRRNVRPLMMSPGLLAFSRVDREDLVVIDIHLGSEEVQEHEPGSEEPVLVNTGKETCQVLIDQDQIGVDRRRF